jgi:hypothetical protein
MITHDQSWSLPRGNTPVPSRWQATAAAIPPPSQATLGPPAAWRTRRPAAPPTRKAALRGRILSRVR